MNSIPDDLIALATERALIEFEERHDAFHRQTQRTIEEMNARGLLHSGLTRMRIRNEIKNEIAIRVMLAWQVLARVLSGESLPPNDSVADDSKAFVRSVVEGGCGDLRSQYDRLPGLTGERGASREPFEQLATLALRKADAEIEIGLRKATRQDSSPSTINIYQPYGIVQTGAGSTATFNAALSEHRDIIDGALTAIDAVLASTAELEPTTVSETRELIRDARAELDRPQPNALRIRSALTGIATTVQTLGSAASAYQLLKGAAALFGVPLP